MLSKRFLVLLATFLVAAFIASGGNSLTEVPVANAAHANQLELAVATAPAGGAGFDFQVDGPGVCDSNFNNLSDGDSTIGATCAAAGVWTITVNLPAGWFIASINCLVLDENIAGVDSVLPPNTPANPFNVTINDDEHVFCTVAFTSGGGGGGGGNGQVQDFLFFLEAEPNVLYCGGTTRIHAILQDELGNQLPGRVFNFVTTHGELTQIDDDTIELFIDPAMPNPKNNPDSPDILVTAFIDAVVDFDENGAPIFEIIQASTVIQNFCSAYLTAVVVTSNPNVVPCAGGAVQLSASGRDAAGHVIKGLGFHFSTDAGQLVVGPPPTAEAEQQFATLTILPDMVLPSVGGADAVTVLVSVGNMIGTVEGQATLYRHCPTSQNKPGTITLKSSSPTVFCGGKVFINAAVVDQKGNTPKDGTPISFIVDVGSIVSADSSSSSSSSEEGGGAASAPASTTTTGGSLNIIYTASPGSRGISRISAAGGSAFGYIDIEVKCDTTTGSTQGTSTSAGASGGCNPIGGIVCIKPPNTGDAGLVSSSRE